MSIMTRVFRLFEADIHGVVDQLEDKELLMNQYLREMEAALDEKEAELKHLLISEEDTRNEKDKYVSEIKKIESDLEAAVSKDRDDIARFLIKKHNNLKRYGDELERHFQTLKKDIDQRREQMEEQKLEYERLRLRSKAYFHNAERRAWDHNLSGMMPGQHHSELSDEEVEIELLRRKEEIKGDGK